MKTVKNNNPKIMLKENHINVWKIEETARQTVRKIRLTPHNIVSAFDYFDKNILRKNSFSANQRANLFIQLIINPNENFIHPKLKNALVTKSFGDVNVNGSSFSGFFSHFEGCVYSPKEKESLTALVDRLVEDKARRRKGEFFTPTEFVDLAHHYISKGYGADWKDQFTVWDCAWGTGNLTRDYKFADLYCSTLESSDIATAEQMGYNPEACKFQFDFLNDPLEKLPQGLLDSINNGKPLLFLINPPYVGAGVKGANSDHRAGVLDTEVGRLMKAEGYGKASQNLYTQFIYRICQINAVNKSVKLAIFCPPTFLTGGSYVKFREKLFASFGFNGGFLFEASNFADVVSGWGISFTILDSQSHVTDTVFDLVEPSADFSLKLVGEKTIYNADDAIPCSEWVREESKGKKTFDAPQLSSAINVKPYGKGNIMPDALGYFATWGNNVMYNQTNVAMFSAPFSSANGISVIPQNFEKVISLFTARSVVKVNWVNCKDEYLTPNVNHEDYQQFVTDSIVYCLFASKSQQSSLRSILYKGKSWEIKNEFFWAPKSLMLHLAEEHNFDELYKDARTSSDRFVYNKLFNEGYYSQLSEEAREVLENASKLLVDSFHIRKVIAESHPERHLASWDAGYAQLKTVWKEYFKDEFRDFREKFKKLEARLNPLVYELGFLKK